MPTNASDGFHVTATHTTVYWTTTLHTFQDSYILKLGWARVSMHVVKTRKFQTSAAYKFDCKEIIMD